mgnify:FL=1
MPVRMWCGQHSRLTAQETEAPQAQRSYFERERERLVAEIAEVRRSRRRSVASMATPLTGRASRR